jgi:hypothetical protein
MGHGPAHGAPGRDADPGPEPAGLDFDPRADGDRGHDPGILLRHLTQIGNATCTGPGCRRPATQSDFEHNVPYEAGGRTCTCNGDPKCRHDHRLNSTSDGQPST